MQTKEVKILETVEDLISEAKGKEADLFVSFSAGRFKLLGPEAENYVLASTFPKTDDELARALLAYLGIETHPDSIFSVHMGD